MRRRSWLRRRTVQQLAGFGSVWTSTAPHPQRARAQIDARKRLLSNLIPKKYAVRKVVGNNCEIRHRLGAMNG
jgi:hypothetical protein